MQSLHISFRFEIMIFVYRWDKRKPLTNTYSDDWSNDIIATIHRLNLTDLKFTDSRLHLIFRHLINLHGEILVGSQLHVGLYGFWVHCIIQGHLDTVCGKEDLRVNPQLINSCLTN